MNETTVQGEAISEAYAATETAADVRAVAQRAGFIRNLLVEGARHWNTSERAVLVICCVPPMVCLAGILMGLISKDLYKWFTGEDRFAEDLQVLICFLAFVLSLVMVRRLWLGGQKWIALLYVCLSFGLFFITGEEISWGQNIFRWETPESIDAINVQGETNLHNLIGFHSATGWLQLLVGAYGSILPWLVFGWRAVAPYRANLNLVVPHYTLVPYFFFLFVWRIYRNFWPLPQRHHLAIFQYNEVLELLLYTGFFLFLMLQLRRFNQGRGADGSSGDDRN